MGGLIGVATANKDGLMNKHKVYSSIGKVNGRYCKIDAFISNLGEIYESIISVTNVDGETFSFMLSMVRWNHNRVFCKLVNGNYLSGFSLYYIINTDKCSLYLKVEWYAKIVVSKLGIPCRTTIEMIDSIPSNVKSLTLS